MEGGNAICVSISFLGNFQPAYFFHHILKFQNQQKISTDS